MLRLRNALSISLTTLAVTSAPAMAATYGYELTINDPIFNAASGNQNVPDFQLTNISDLGSGIGITSFNLTIGDTSFNYDFVRIQTVDTDPGSDLSFTLNTVGTSSPTGLTGGNNGVGDDALNYTFSGFDAGDVFQFEVDVDPDSGAATQDFRDIIFPNAVVSVGFSNGETLSQALNPSSISPINYTFEQSVTPSPVPLPAGLPLYLGAGVVLGMFMRRRRS